MILGPNGGEARNDVDDAGKWNSCRPGSLMEKPSRLIKPSTRHFFSESRKLNRYGPMEWLHGYIYGRWPYFYIGVGTGEHWLVKRCKPAGAMLFALYRLLFGSAKAKPSDASVTFADTYHGKVIPLENARKLVTVNQPVKLPDLEKVVPYKRARDLILENPDHIVALECPCRSVRENPCLPLDVCLIIGEPFAGFMLEHHKQKARAISRDEAVAILEAENRRGHVAHAFFKDAMLDRFYAICNCCSCCCGAMQSQRNGTPMLASSGYVCKLDVEKCVKCGDCEPLCQFGAIDLSRGYQIDEAACMGCGVCVNACQREALSLVLDASRGEPLEIHRLMYDCAAGARPKTMRQQEQA
jgi:Pyruvate/2-oxoacid:ferredoxin oxidoreductase delta subunit